ncbi:hypothetical protein LG284_16435 (plasmid) [Citricoccus nitrophenolicus]
MTTTPHTAARMFAARLHELPLVATTIYRAELRAARRPAGARARTVLALRLGATVATAMAASYAATHGQPWAALPLGLITLAIMAGPLAITALPGWIAWTDTKGHAVTITDPNANPIGHWSLTPAPGGSRLEAHLAAMLDGRPPAAESRPDLITAEQVPVPQWDTRHHTN